MWCIVLCFNMHIDTDLIHMHWVICPVRYAFSCIIFNTCNMPCKLIKRHMIVSFVEIDAFLHLCFVCVKIPVTVKLFSLVSRE